MLGDLAEAEDVTQEAYGRAWSQWSRRAARRFPQQPPTPAVEPGVESVAVVEALRALPADQRRDVVLFYLADLSVDRIAQETASTPSAVKSRLSRARKRLAGLLQEELEVEEHG